VNVEMHPEIVIELVWRGSSRPYSCELAGCSRGSLDIHLEAVIERDEICTWRA